MTKNRRRFTQPNSPSKTRSKTLQSSYDQVKKTDTQNLPISFDIENLSHEGRGIALYQQHNCQQIKQYGKKVFVRFALQGETVLAQITHQHKRFDEAKLLQVIAKPSPYRVEPECRHFMECGGCALQHMHTAEQLRFKQHVLASHLQHFAGIQPKEWLMPIQNERSDYRQRARLGVRWREKSQQMVIGFREEQSNYLIPIQHCTVLDQRVAQYLPELTKTLVALENKHNITHIEFILGDQDVALLIRHLKPLITKDLQKLQSFVANYHWQLYLLTEHADKGKSLQRVDAKNATMRLFYDLPDFAVSLAFSPLDFTQVNAQVNRKMVRLACDLLALKSGERVLDLFCGLGNFSLPLARCVGETGQVIAVVGQKMHNVIIYHSFAFINKIYR